MAAELSRGEATLGVQQESLATLRKTADEHGAQKAHVGAARRSLAALTRSAAADRLVLWLGSGLFALVVLHISLKRVPFLTPLHPAYQFRQYRLAVAQRRAAAQLSPAPALGFSGGADVTPSEPAAALPEPPAPPPPPPPPELYHEAELLVDSAPEWTAAPLVEAAVEPEPSGERGDTSGETPGDAPPEEEPRAEPESTHGASGADGEL